MTSLFKFLIALGLTLFSFTVSIKTLGQIDTKPLEVFDYVKGEVLIKFKEGTIAHEFQMADQISGMANDVMTDKANDFLKSFKENKLRKVVSKFKPGILNSISREGVVVEVPDYHNLFVMEVNQNEDIVALCETLRKMDNIEIAEPNFIGKGGDNPPNDVKFNLQTGFEQVSDKDIDANRAWDFTTGRYEIKVAVIDNGIDYNHPDLGNGAFGYEGAKVRGGWDYWNNDADPNYTENAPASHGTEVAGIIGAFRNNNSIGIAGLAGGNGNGNIGVQLFALKIAGSGGWPTDKVVAAITEASIWTPSFGYGCHIINFSGWNFPASEVLRTAVRTAAQNNVVFVAIKGNGNSSNFNYPSDYDKEWVISVGATDSFDKRSVWSSSRASNTGNNIDVAAPGSGGGLFNVHTTTVAGNGNYRSFDGTSAAAPHVSGLAALILSNAIDQNISLHHEDVEGVIKFSAEDVNSATLPGYDNDLGYGRINAGRALEMMNQPWELTHSSIVGGTIVNSSDWFTGILTNPGGGLPSGAYALKRHEVHKTVSIPFFTGDHFAWGRGANATSGWSYSIPNHQIGFCDVVASTATTVTLRTFIYEVKTISGVSLGWKPTTVGNVTFAYTTLGTPCPPSLNITMAINAGTRNTATVYAASDNINASNIINSGTDIIYSAGNTVTLLPGFEVKPSNTFRAVTTGCISGNIGGRVRNGQSEPIKIAYEPISEIEESIEKEIVIVSPNPFDNNITFEYYIKEDSKVTLQIFDLTGKIVATLVDNDPKIKGIHHENFGGDYLLNGIYIFRMRTNSSVLTGRIIKSN
ncbi:MAG: S8 family peptidase [Cyclobacteriaceae bacterium]|nr:S8 family peptidase [Cyclobacteriaceae bacterium]